MYISSWEEFKKAAVDLYDSSPDTARFVHTFRHGDGKLILKVTDDRTVIKHKITEQRDLKKFIELSNVVMAKMQNTFAGSKETTEIPMDITPSQPSATHSGSPVTPSTPKATKKSEKKKNDHRRR